MAISTDIATWILAFVDWGILVLLILIVVEVFKFFLVGQPKPTPLTIPDTWKKKAEERFKEIVVPDKVRNTIKKERSGAEHYLLPVHKELEKVEMDLAKLYKAKDAKEAEKAWKQMYALLHKQTTPSRRIAHHLDPLIAEIDELTTHLPHKKADLNDVKTEISTEKKNLVGLLSKGGDLENELNNVDAEIKSWTAGPFPAALRVKAKGFETKLNETLTAIQAILASFKKLEKIENF